MSKVFVAGGSGRVATELIKDLIKDGNEVRDLLVRNI